MTDYSRLAIVRYPAGPLLRQVWELRERLTAYDATFVSPAQTPGCPLVTCDRKLKVPGVQIERH